VDNKAINWIIIKGLKNLEKFRGRVYHKGIREKIGLQKSKR